MNGRRRGTEGLTLSPDVQQLFLGGGQPNAQSSDVVLRLLSGGLVRGARGYRLPSAEGGGDLFPQSFDVATGVLEELLSSRAGVRLGELGGHGGVDDQDRAGEDRAEQLVGALDVVDGLLQRGGSARTGGRLLPAALTRTSGCMAVMRR